MQTRKQNSSKETIENGLCIADVEIMSISKLKSSKKCKKKMEIKLIA